MPKPSSLDEFAATARHRTGPPSYLDALPDDVRDQIRTSPAGHTVVVKWLHGLGYDRATAQMVTKWRQREGWRR
jgi:hypothetical protein